MDNQFTFLKRRQDFEQQHFDNKNVENILKSIFVVDVSTTDLCNRTCVFCPRHDPSVYPNRKLHMTGSGAQIVAKKFGEIDYSGTIALSGFGENLLNPNILDIVKAFRNYVPKSFIECNTNGDPLNASLAESLVNAGVDCININLYDGPHQIEKFDTITKQLPENAFKYRVHWGSEDFGLIYNNRSGVIQWLDHKQSNNNKGCYYPFYKMFVDWNGDVLFCANDWGRERVVGNLLQQSILEIWMSSEMKKIRLKLTNQGRVLSPCDKCNVDGLLVGKQSHDILMDFYNENTSNRKFKASRSNS